MTDLFEILNWIDQRMPFDTWYNVESDTQKQKIIQLMDTDLIPDCEFNSDYSKFRKSKLANLYFVKNISI